MVTLVACCVTKCQEVPIRLAQIWHSIFLYLSVTAHPGLEVP